jgi:hypothetical protein
MEIVGCLVDPGEIAEAYLLRTLTEEQSTAFEDHFLGCPRCSERLQFTQDFIEAVRRAAAQLPTKAAAARA